MTPAPDAIVIGSGPNGLAAAIRLAQGAGRLIRSTGDKGVVAVLDSRLATERYAGFLRAALPPFWPTTDRKTALAALERLAGSDGQQAG